MGKGLSLSVFLFLLAFSGLTEGTRQMSPFANAPGWLCIDKNRNDFGFFDAAPEFRINIFVAGTSEKILFGFGRFRNNDSNNVQYRLKDPAGNIVIGPNAIPSSGAGRIDSYNQAVNGPLPATNGYSPIQCSPLLTGDYSLEIYYPPDSAGHYSMSGAIMFEFFDISVVNPANQQIPGRVWSKAWQFNSGEVKLPPTNNRFWGTMFILSDDSIVTSVNCNGFVGGTFSISSNKTGCSSTGNIITDRQSRTGFHTYPQYKLFLSDPDSLIFPTGKARPGIQLPILAETSCTTEDVNFKVKVDKDGQVEIFIEVNPNPGVDPEDVKLTANVLANPVGNGFNIIHWNGNDGKGKPVKSGAAVTATVSYIHGITHLPIYDIEYNDSGYIVKVVRPPGPNPLIFWDDTLIPGDNSVNLTGCNDFFGCHLWNIDVGNVNTINSWWYVAGSTASPISFKFKRTPIPPGVISGNPAICAGTASRQFSVVADSSSTSYNWSYSGTGVTITGNGPSVIVNFSDNATSGTLTVSGYNEDCGSGPASNLALNIYPIPIVSIGKLDSVCYNLPAFPLSTGTPGGGEFIVNGVHETEFDPAREGPGSHLIVYWYTDTHGCSNSDSTTVFITSGHECDAVVWVPNSFTPNGDGKNDKFHPVTSNIGQITIYIYNRTGQLVFSSGENDRWDGTFMGRPCPSGNYVYKIFYQSSVNPPEYKTISGNVILVR